MISANDDEILTWDMPGISKMYVLYIECPVYVPNVPFHDRGTFKECIAVFDSITALDEYTRCRFGMAYSTRMEFEYAQIQDAMHTGNADGMFVTDDRYGVDIVPMFTDTKIIPEYAKKMAKWDNRFGGLSGQEEKGK